MHEDGTTDVDDGRRADDPHAIDRDALRAREPELLDQHADVLRRDERVDAAIRHDSNGFWLTTTYPLGPSLPSPSALTWFGEDRLLVVTGSGASSQLWEVPVDGANPTSLIKAPGILTVAAAGPGSPYYVGLAGNQLEKAAGPNQLLGGIPAGQAIIYPG